MLHRVGLITITVLVAASACAPGSTSSSSSAGSPALAATTLDLVAPTPAGATFPRLTASGDRLRLSWLEPDEEPGFWRLVTTTGDGSVWEPARTVTRSDQLFVNWADFPAVVETADGALVAHWLQKSGPSTYAYDVRMAVSHDAGSTWGDSFTPHRDGVAAEHGFVSLVPEADGTVTAVWLDGRETVNDGPMTLRTAVVAGDGTLGPETVIDARVCDCCQTAAAALGDDLVAVYRDRSDEEIRDIWSARRHQGQWQEPVRVAEDNWQIPGCPVNGPAIAADATRLAVAWFALVDGAPEVKVAFSDDAGASWNEPILVERGTVQEATHGRVDVAWIGEGQVAVSWLTGIDEVGEIRVRAVGADGSMQPFVVVGRTSSSRAAGFPRMLRQGGQLVFAWTEPGEPDVVRMAALPLLADD